MAYLNGSNLTERNWRSLGVSPHSFEIVQQGPIKEDMKPFVTFVISCIFTSLCSALVYLLAVISDNAPSESFLIMVTTLIFIIAMRVAWTDMGTIFKSNSANNSAAYYDATKNTSIIARIAKACTLITSKIIGAILDLKNEVEFNIESKNASFYAQAEIEFENGDIDKGLWSQALVKSRGDDSLRKVEYMKLRAMQLKKKP